MKNKHMNLILIVLLFLAAAIAFGLFYLIHMKQAQNQDQGNHTDEASVSTSGISEGGNDYIISLIGDCTLASDQYDPVFEKTISDKGFGWPFSKTKDIFQSDELTIANLECSFSDDSLSSASLYYYCAPQKNAEILSEGGVDCVTLGNNHTNDFGKQGLSDTQKALDHARVQWVEQEDARVIETKNGLKIGIYCPGWTGLNEANIQNGIAELRSAGADICIFAPHWGSEGESEVSYNQIDFGHIAVDAGAQIVCGTHPQVLQKVEEYNGSYIFYSLGNWIFGGSTSLPDNDTVVIQISVQKNIDGSCRISGYSIIPCGHSSVSGQNDHCPIPYQEGTQEYERVIQALKGN